MTALRGIGNIPNTTSLLGSSVNEKAALRSWFVPTAKNWVNVENGNILRNMLAQILTGKLTDQAGGPVGERQHHLGPERIGRGPGGTRISLTSSRVPDRTERRRGRVRSASTSSPSIRERGLRASVPYLLILPVLVAITAILGYPLYRLVVLSFQQYGLAELIQHKGEWVGLENYSSVLHDPVFWHTLLRTIVFTAVNVGLTMGIGTLLARFCCRSAPSSGSCSRPASCSSGRCPSSSPCRSGTG